jgi:putative salt-induced outer membrane protein
MADEDEGPWSGNVTLGYLATSGNTENSNLNAAFEVAYAANKWVHSFRAAAISATESNATTAEAYDAGWRSERNFTETNFLFGRLDWRSDRFSTYEKQFSQTAGYGRRVISGDTHNLSIEVGAGARQSDLADGSSESELIFRGGAKYVWTLSETSDFTQVLNVEAGQVNTFLESVTALSAKLVGNLSLVASYTVRHNTDVLPTTEKTDTFTALSLEYLF